MPNDDIRDAFAPDEPTPLSYVTSGLGAGPFFNQDGHLIIQPASDDNRDIIFGVRKDDTTIVPGLRIISNEGDEPDVIVGSTQLAVSAATGYINMPYMPGPPTGTPTNAGDGVPAVIDATSATLYLYTGASWEPVSGSAGAHGNVGGGAEVFKENLGGSSNLRTLVGIDGIEITQLAETITIGAGAVQHHDTLGLGDDDHPQYQLRTEKGTANGYAGLDGGGKVPTSQLPQIAFTEVFVVADITARDALTVQEGDVAKVTDDGTGEANTYIYDGTTWIELSVNDAVDSVNGYLGTVVLDTDDLSEGTNLYFTNERAQDAVGTILTDTASIDFTYNDGANTISAVVLPAGVDHDLLLNFVADEHVAHSGVTLTAGAGLTGGGTIAASRTFNIGAGTGITVNADDIAVNLSVFDTDDLAEGATNLYFSAAEQSKLAGIESGATADQTAADIRGLGFFDTSNDGASSGLDADLLDGQHGSYYQNAANLTSGILPAARFNDTAHGSRGGASLHALATAGTHGFLASSDKSKLDGIESGATADQSPSEILAALLTVDGSGSGLDADLLDGISSASFLRSDAADQVNGVLTFLNTAIPVYNSHPTFSADLQLVDKKYVDDNISAASDPLTVKEQDGTPTVGNVSTLEFAGVLTVTDQGSNTARVTLTAGAGSGLDADLLDGIHAAELFNNMGNNHGTYTDFNGPTDFGPRYIQSTTNGPGVSGATQYYNFGLGLGAEYPYTQYAMQFAIPRTPSGGLPRPSVRFREAGAWGGWAGLDADTVDGLDSTSFLRSDAADTSSAMISFYTSLTNNDDYVNSPISIRERALAGAGDGEDRDAPNLNFHWGGRISKSLVMNASGVLSWGEYNSSGVPQHDGYFRASRHYADATSYVGLGSGTALRHQTAYGYVDIGPQNGGAAHIYTDRASFFFNRHIYPTPNNTYNVGDPTAKWANGYFTNVHTGDLVMHDPKCVACGYDFEEEDNLYMRVIKVEGPADDRALRTVPVHDYCKGIAVKYYVAP